ncbi:MAG: hypothetical protein WAL12_01590 [Trebonia sp.]
MTVLSIAGIAGLLFGVVGWKQGGIDTVTAPPVAATSSPAAASSPSATVSASATVPASAAGAAGPLLSSMPYASFAYLVWPGPVSADGKLAMSRWKLTVTRQAGGITVQAAEDGQSMASVSGFYPGGAKVYILDSDLGADAAGNTNEGLEVTNTQGQVLP